jgi:hypothetical protein
MSGETPKSAARTLVTKGDSDSEEIYHSAAEDTNDSGQESGQGVEESGQGVQESGQGLKELRQGPEESEQNSQEGEGKGKDVTSTEEEGGGAMEKVELSEEEIRVSS